MAFVVCDLFRKLIEAEVIPPEARRVIIDVAYDRVARVLYDCHAQKEMVDHPELVQALIRSEPVVERVGAA